MLGIPIDATKEEIRSAYRRLVFKYHPDRNNSPKAIKKMQDINEAYKELMSGRFSKPVIVRKRFSYMRQEFIREQKEKIKIKAQEEIRRREILERMVDNDAIRQERELDEVFDDLLKSIGL